LVMTFAHDATPGAGRDVDDIINIRTATHAHTDTQRQTKRGRERD